MVQQDDEITQTVQEEYLVVEWFRFNKTFHKSRSACVGNNYEFILENLIGIIVK